MAHLGFDLSLDEDLNALKEPYQAVDNENVQIDPRSPSQLEEYFRGILVNINKESGPYRQIVPGLYYVVCGIHIREIDLVKGEYFLNFAPSFSPVDVLRNRVLAGGVPAADTVAVSTAVEELSQKEVAYNQAQLRKYVRYLCGLHQISETPKEILFVLHDRLSEKKRFRELALQHCIVRGQRPFLQELFDDVVKQLEVVSIALKIRSFL